MYLTEVAEGRRQGIRSVIRFGDFGQPELETDHLLYLLLGAGAVVGHPLLYLGGGILVGGDASVGRGQYRYRLGLTNRQGGAGPW